MPKHQNPKSAAYTSARKLSTSVCPKCEGEGWVVEEVDDGRAEVTERCPECKGDGFVYVEEPTKKTAPLVAMKKETEIK